MRSARKHIGWAVRALPGGEAFRARDERASRTAARSSHAVDDYFDALADVASAAACGQRRSGDRGMTPHDAVGRGMSRKAIDECVRTSVEQYFKDLRGAEPAALHDLFLGAAEKPLLEVVLRHADGNQSKAADWLGHQPQHAAAQAARPQADP